MGRVARYKKVKSFDPYSKESKKKSNHSRTLYDEYIWGSSETRKPKKRSARSMALRQQKVKNQRPNKRKQTTNSNNNNDGFDAPPEKDDFDLNDIVGSVKKEALTTIPKSEPSTTTQKAQPSSPPPPTAAVSTLETLNKTDDLDTVKQKMTNERKEHQELLRFTTQTKNGKLRQEKNVFEKKQEGESMRAYEKRIKEETRRIIDTNKLTTEKETATSKQQQQQPGDDTTNKRRQRTKDYLQQKKLKRKKKLQSFTNNNDKNEDDPTRGDSDDDNFVTGEEAIRQQQLAFLNPVEQPPTFTQLPRGAPKRAKLLHKPRNSKTNNSGRSSMDEAKIMAEQKSMEAMRLRVQSQYALIKAKRKQMGDFHL